MYLADWYRQSADIKLQIGWLIDNVNQWKSVMKWVRTSLAHKIFMWFSHGEHLLGHAHGLWLAVGQGGSCIGKCLGAALSLLLSDKSHIFADQINLIDITQNDGRKVSTFVLATATKNANKWVQMGLRFGAEWAHAPGSFWLNGGCVSEQRRGSFPARLATQRDLFSFRCHRLRHPNSTLRHPDIRIEMQILTNVRTLRA